MEDIFDKKLEAFGSSKGIKNEAITNNKVYMTFRAYLQCI